MVTMVLIKRNIKQTPNIRAIKYHSVFLQFKKLKISDCLEKVSMSSSNKFENYLNMVQKRLLKNKNGV